MSDVKLFFSFLAGHSPAIYSKPLFKKAVLFCTFWNGHQPENIKKQKCVPSAGRTGIIAE
jgi:hypothetical protein